MTTTVLLTGFAPFGGDAANPSGDAVRRIADEWDGPERLIVDVLPVTFAGAAERMRALVAAHSPDVIVATGLAGGRSAITPERVAINLMDARIPDNDGRQPIDEESEPGGPAARFATLPVKAIVGALTSAGIPAGLSHSAGTFVCNHVMYAAASASARAGFIHVPWSSESAPDGAPSLPLDDIVRGVTLAIRTSIEVETDIRSAAGELH